MKTHKDNIDPSEVTRIRVHDEGYDCWAIDGADDCGNFTDACWNCDGNPDETLTRERAIELADDFARENELPPGLPIYAQDSDGGWEVVRTRQEAGAQMISRAAPEMLDALRGLVERIETYAEWASREKVADPKFNPRPLCDLILESVRSHGAIDDARAAIAKATGQHR